jgi:hypothetical protein
MLITATSDDGNSIQLSLPANESVFVGRSSNCRLRLPDPAIADIHCLIESQAGKMWIQDWMSNGGTCVNGEPIWTKVELSPEDTIRVGKHSLSFAGSARQQRPEDEPPHNPAPVVETADDSPDSMIDLNADLNADLPPELHDAQIEDSFAGPPEVAVDAANVEDWELADATDLLDIDFLDDDDQAAIERETVEILQAEIAQLRAELAERDADQQCQIDHSDSAPEQDADQLLTRMQELIDDADRSDERVRILEEMLCAAESTNRAEQEERTHLDAWVGEIETRIGHREGEHKAELEQLRMQLDQATVQQQQLQRRLQHVAQGAGAAPQYQQALAELQQTNQALQQQLNDLQQQNRVLQQQVDDAGQTQESLLREERAKLAKEQADVSRLRFELTSRLTEIAELPRPENQVDLETSHRIQALRQHLREIHEQEKQRERDAPLTTRLARLWKRVDEY